MALHISYLSLTLLTLGIYFMWMDVALYINLQQSSPLRNGSRSAIGTTSKSYSPFYPMTIKSLFQGPTMQYIDESLVHWTVTETHLAAWVTADFVSVLGVVMAFIAARLFCSDSLRVRQIGVIFFKLRDYLDSLDGRVARERRNLHIMTVETGTFGYYFDGWCDIFADVFIYHAIFYQFHRHNTMANYQASLTHSSGVNGDRTLYRRLSAAEAGDKKPAAPSKMKNEVNIFRMSFCRTWWPVYCLCWVVAVQTILSSAAWNYNLVRYSEIFDTTRIASSPAQASAQDEALKSSTMWMVIYFWRLFNPHSINQFLLIAVLYNKTFEYFITMQYLGYLPIAFVAGLSHIYANVLTSNIEAIG